MIYTITCNPSLDYTVSVENFALGKTNRTSSEQIFPGGKGINVSMMLGSLGMESVALGFIAGFVGEEIERQTKAKGVHTEFIRLPFGNSRINLKLKNYDGTEINGMGPAVPEEGLAGLYEQTDGLRQGDVLVLAGSVPGSLPVDLYARLLERLSDRGVLCVVDTTGPQLWEVLPYKPFLIKPNRGELGELFATTIRTRQEAVPYAVKLHDMGAVNVLVSLSGQGAVLVDADGMVYECEAPKGRLVNAVGAGDSMVAGFLTGWLMEQDSRHAFFMGLAAGSASAFSEHFATGEEVKTVFRQLAEKNRI